MHLSTLKQWKISKKSCRVDLKIKVEAHNNLEEQRVLTLQKFLWKLQCFDPKIQLAPWQEDTTDPSIALQHDITSRLSEFKKNVSQEFFFREEGFTQYLGTRLIHLHSRFAQGHDPLMDVSRECCRQRTPWKLVGQYIAPGRWRRVFWHMPQRM